MHCPKGDVDEKYLDRLISVIAYRICCERRIYEEFPVLSPGEFTRADVEFIRIILNSTRISEDTKEYMSKSTVHRKNEGPEDTAVLPCRTGTL